MTRALAIGIAATVLLGIGCRGEAPSRSAERYTFRAEVIRLPASGSGEVLLRHERIPEFRNQAGEVVGMDAMTMPFDLAPGTSTEGLAAGDEVEVVLAADWTKPSFRVERLTKLPAGTELRFTPSR